MPSYQIGVLLGHESIKEAHKMYCILQHVIYQMCVWKTCYGHFLVLLGQFVHLLSLLRCQIIIFAFLLAFYIIKQSIIRIFHIILSGIVSKTFKICQDVSRASCDVYLYCAFFMAFLTASWSTYRGNLPALTY